MQPETQLLGTTSGGWRFSKHRIIVFTWTPSTKGKRDRSRAGEFRRSVRGGSAVTEEVYNPWRFRLCEGAKGLSYISRARARITKRLRLWPAASAWILRRGNGHDVREYRAILKNSHHNPKMSFAFVGNSSFSSGTGAINTQIICILLNGGYLSLELRADRAGREMRCIPFGEALVHQHIDRPGWHEYELAASYIRKNISVAYANRITDATLHKMNASRCWDILFVKDMCPFSIKSSYQIRIRPYILCLDT